MKYKAIVEIKYQVYIKNGLGIANLIAEFDTCKEAVTYTNTLNNLGIFFEKAYVKHGIVSIKNLENIEESAE